MRRLEVVPEGRVVSGFLEYRFIPENAALQYQGSVRFNVGLGIKKNFPFAGIQPIAPEELESAKYAQVGAPIEFGNLTGKIIKVEGNVAVASVRLKDTNAQGTGTFDLSGKYVELESINAYGSYGPYKNIHLFLQKEEHFFGLLSKKDTVWPIPEEKKEEEKK